MAKEYATDDKWNPTRVIQLPGGSYVIGGYMFLPNSSHQPHPLPYVKRIDEFGNLLWTQIYQGPVGSFLDVIGQNGGAGSIAVGSSNGRAIIQETTSNGTPGVSTTVPGHVPTAIAIVSRNEGGYAVAADLVTTTASLLLLDDSLTLERQIDFSFGQEKMIVVEAISNSPLGYVIWGSVRNSMGPAEYRGIMIATDFAGDTLFTKRFEYEDKWVEIRSVTESDSGFVVAGNVWVSGLNSNLLILAITPQGDILWERQFEIGWPIHPSIVRTLSGGYLLAYADNPSGGSEVAVIQKLNNLGDSLWSVELPYPNSFWNYTSSACVTSEGGYMVVMSPTLSAGYNPDVLAKFSPDYDDSVTAAHRPHVSRFSLGQNFPNPFNVSTTIPFALNKDAKVELRLFDVLGRQHSTLTNGFFNAGEYQIPFDGYSLPTGSYYYQLEVNGMPETRRLLLIK